MNKATTPERRPGKRKASFFGVGWERRRELEALCTVQRYEPQQVVFRYGDPLYLMAASEVHVFTHSNAEQESVQETVGPGAVLGEVALFGGDGPAA